MNLKSDEEEGRKGGNWVDYIVNGKRRRKEGRKDKIAYTSVLYPLFLLQFQDHSIWFGEIEIEKMKLINQIT